MLALCLLLAFSFSSAATWPQSATSSPTQPTPPTGQPHGMRYTLEPVSTPNAVYPEHARKKKLEGRIIARFEVSENGDVAGVWVSGWDLDLIKAVEANVKDAVGQWKFRPVIQNGNPIRVFGEATFMFDLRDATQWANGVPGEILGGMDIPVAIRLSSGIMQKLLLRKVDPVYPEEAKRNHIRGAVLLAVTIDRQGAVTDVQPVSGPPELASAAAEAVKQWHYKPYLMWDRPLVVHTQIEIDFPNAVGRIATR